ncbi:FGFR1 oncogene partner, partial [Eschrichtius robustus]|nr:FGFR1 oncogene partner [Eschrichtius robustus]
MQLFSKLSSHPVILKPCSPSYVKERSARTGLLTFLVGGSSLREVLSWLTLSLASAQQLPLHLHNKTPLVNESLKKFLNTKDGRLVASLVAEFLQFFNLDFTLAVFQPETSTFQGLEGRENLARDLGIIEAEGTKASNDASQSDASISSSEPKSKSSLHLLAHETKIGSLLSNKSLDVKDEAGPCPDEDDMEGDSFFDDPIPKPEKTYGWRSEPSKQVGSLASLSDAPPLKSGLSSLTGAPSLKDSE